MNKPKPNDRLQGGDIVKEEEVCVCFNIRKAARIITHLYDEVMRPTGYRGTQITLLGVVSRFQPITVKKLAAFSDSEPTTLLRNLRLLEKNKLVLLQQQESDHRAQVVTMTEKGVVLLRKAYPLWKQMQDRIAGKVGKKQLNKILHDLQDALDMIQEDKKNPVHGGDS